VTVNGIDFLEVRTLERPDRSYPNLLLIIHCFKPTVLSQDNILITGGTRIKNIAVDWVYGAEHLKANHPELLSDKELCHNHY
jgi:hypothetical protein